MAVFIFKSAAIMALVLLQMSVGWNKWKTKKKQQDTIKKFKFNQKENSRYEKMHEQNQLKRQINLMYASNEQYIY